MRRFRLATATASLLILAAGIATSNTATAQSAGGFQIEETTISAIQSAILSKQITSEQLVKLYLQRIKAYNGTCVNQPNGILGVVSTIPNAGQINALSTLNLRPETRKQWGFDERKARSMTDAVDNDPAMPDALETARTLDAYVAQNGRLMGPLHGVVMAIKDQYDTADMRTTAGADTLYANDRPPDDATFVKRLRAAGAIVIAKSNLGEFASAIARSSFGGTFCNPYDTERTPWGSSSGSGSAVGANLVTCAIAEETGSSIRGPAYAASSVGIAPTHELVSRDGMIQQGLITRVGPICRNVEDAARVLTVIAGYDHKDPLTAHSVGRIPAAGYESAAKTRRLDGLRIGVVREYMNKSAFTKEDEQAIDIVGVAVKDLAKLGATMVDPGPDGALFNSCVRENLPQLVDAQFVDKNKDLFPKDGNTIGKLIDLGLDPSQLPKNIGFRQLSAPGGEGEGAYWLERYLRERGDAKVNTIEHLLSKAHYYEDPQYPDHRRRHKRELEAKELDMSKRLQFRFAVQTMVMQCMADLKLDAVVFPTSNMAPQKLGSPRGPAMDGRPGDGVWRFFGGNGFPVLTVPAGFTTETWDRVRVKAPSNQGDEETKLVGPVPAVLPIGMDIAARPFDELTLVKIAAAYEAATRHRKAPVGYGPVK